MADVSQIFFSHAEVVEALLRMQGIKKGIWSLSVNLRMAPNNFLADGMDTASPGCAVIIEKIGMQRVHEFIAGLTVDASTLTGKPSLHVIE